MDDPDICHLLLIMGSLVTLLVEPAGQIAMAAMFVLPCLWYVHEAYQSEVASQVAGMWRERIRGVRG